MVYSTIVSGLLLAVCGAVNLQETSQQPGNAGEVTAPAEVEWQKLTDSVEHDEPVSKADIAIWLNGVCDDTMTQAIHGQDFVKFVANETGMTEVFGVEHLAEHLNTKYGVTQAEFNTVLASCFADITEADEDHSDHEGHSDDKLVEPTMEEMKSAINEVQGRVVSLQGRVEEQKERMVQFYHEMASLFLPMMNGDHFEGDGHGHSDEHYEGDGHGHSDEHYEGDGHGHSDEHFEGDGHDHSGAITEVFERVESLEGRMDEQSKMLQMLRQELVMTFSGNKDAAE